MNVISVLRTVFCKLTSIANAAKNQQDFIILFSSALHAGTCEPNIWQPKLFDMNDPILKGDTPKIYYQTIVFDSAVVTFGSYTSIVYLEGTSRSSQHHLPEELLKQGPSHCKIHQMNDQDFQQGGCHL